MTGLEQYKLMELSHAATFEVDHWEIELERIGIRMNPAQRDTRRKDFVAGFNRCLAHLVTRRRLVLSDEVDLAGQEPEKNLESARKTP